jgi:uncharacterized membrane protein
LKSRAAVSTLHGLLLMYDTIASALDQDDHTGAGKEKKYGVLDTPDWKEWARALEAELDSRNVTYDKISWTRSRAP